MRLKPRVVIVVAAALCASSCVSFPGAESLAVFEQPVSLLGQEVRVCGYLDSVSNISEQPWGSRAGPGRGLSVKAPTELGRAILGRVRAGERRFCLTGTIFRTGCETDPETVCLEWGFDYGIEVARLNPSSPGLR
jgi:hypothetical protein